MASYKLVTGEMPESYTSDKPELLGLTGLLARYWGELVTTEAPSNEEWECTDVLRDTNSSYMANLAERDKFDKERIRFVPFTEEPLLKFRFGVQSEYVRALMPKTVSYIVVNNSCTHYLVFKRKKIIDEERRQWEENFFEKCFY